MRTTLAILLVATPMHAPVAFHSRAETPKGIRLEQLKGVTNGITLAAVEALLGTNWRHQFSARMENSEYLCISYQFQYPFLYYYFLFRDGHLAKICAPPPFAMDIVNRNGMRIEVRRPVNPVQRVQAVMDARGMSPEELITDIERGIQSKRGGKSLGVLPAFVLTSPLLIARMMLDTPEVERQYRRNEELAEHYDARKLRPGATLADARRIYGEELWERNWKEGMSLVCWGSEEELPKVRREYRYSRVCALVEGVVIKQVYSHDFVQGMDINHVVPAPNEPPRGSSQQ